MYGNVVWFRQPRCFQGKTCGISMSLWFFPVKFVGFPTSFLRASTWATACSARCFSANSWTWGPGLSKNLVILQLEQNPSSDQSTSSMIFQIGPTHSPFLQHRNCFLQGFDWLTVIKVSSHHKSAKETKHELNIFPHSILKYLQPSTKMNQKSKQI